MTTPPVVTKTTSYQLNQLLTSLLQENKSLKQELEKAYTNSNFGCYNRSGAEKRGNEFLTRERRRVQSGQLVMVVCDIAEMGKRNNDIGEEAVNKAIASALAEIRQWRGVEFISQLNSGDEFVFIVDKVDVEGIVTRMDGVFRRHGFEGIYGAVVRIAGCYITSANNGMNSVYKQKNQSVDEGLTRKIIGQSFSVDSIPNTINRGVSIAFGVSPWEKTAQLFRGQCDGKTNSIQKGEKSMLRVGNIVINLNAIAYVDLEATKSYVTRYENTGVRIYLLSNGSTSNLVSLFFQGDDALLLRKYFLLVGELCG
ncbi:MAG: hypothetical protein KME30_13950 [Iphinoe sp. HA4291-MV1]|jgi:GGDEF domain-containing protein|nr:hypothetical protein [Iphinoe sp. HA4291-MV1]